MAAPSGAVQAGDPPSPGAAAGALPLTGGQLSVLALVAVLCLLLGAVAWLAGDRARPDREPQAPAA